MSGIYRVLVGMAACAALFAVLTGDALAAKVTIDDFTDPLSTTIFDVEQDDTPTPVTQNASGVLGGVRYAEVPGGVNVTGSGSLLVRIAPSPGALIFDLDASTVGSVRFTYDAGNGGALGSGGTGLANGTTLIPVGFTKSNSFFAVNIEKVDQGSGKLIIGVEDNDGDFGTVDVGLTQTGQKVEPVPFTLFASNIDFSSVKRVTLELQGTAAQDIVLNSFNAVPEPSTMVLFALGATAFFGTAYFRKRTRKSQSHSQN